MLLKTRLITVLAGLALVAATLSSAHATDKFKGETLNLLTWCDHSGEDVLGPFKDEYGVEINVQEYELTANGLSLARTAGAGFYDVIVVDTVGVAVFVKNGLLEPLDMGKYDLSTFFDDFQDSSSIKVDGETYAIPTKYGFAAIAYNTDHVDPEDVKSWDVLWSEKYRGKVGMYFDPQLMYQYLGLYHGFTPGPYDSDQEGKITEMLRMIKANDFKVLGDVPTIQQALINESAYVIGHGAEFAVAPLIADGLPVAWTIPDEGGLIWVESAAIGAGTKKRELAELLVAYYASPEGNARVATSDCYWALPTNRAAGDHMTEEEKAILEWDNMASYVKKATPYVQIEEQILERWTANIQDILQ